MKNKNLTNGSSIAESTETIKAEVAAQEAKLNEVLELLKSKSISKTEYETLWNNAYEKAIELLDYKVKMGKLIADTKSASGKRSDLAPVGGEVSKEEIFLALGLTKKQAENYQLIAKNPSAVETAKIEAIKDKEIPTVYRIIKLIKQSKKEQDFLNDNETSLIKNRKCIDLPENCDIKDFLESSSKILKFSEKKNTYIYFQVLPNELQSNIETLIISKKRIGICIDKKNK